MKRKQCGLLEAGGAEGVNRPNRVRRPGPGSIVAPAEMTAVTAAWAVEAFSRVQPRRPSDDVPQLREVMVYKADLSTGIRCQWLANQRSPRVSSRLHGVLAYFMQGLTLGEQVPPTAAHSAEQFTCPQHNYHEFEIDAPKKKASALSAVTVL